MAQEPAIKPLKLESPGETAAKMIVRQIERRAGGRFFINMVPGAELQGVCAFTWYYDCPCGETSGYRAMISLLEYDRLDGPMFAKVIEYEVELALEAMRRHVKEEGNEPNF